MNNHQNQTSILKKSVFVGLPTFDIERKDLTRIIEHLDRSPLHTISSEIFLIKFDIFLAALKAFFKREEDFLREHQYHDDATQQHLDEHTRILEMLNAVYIDSMNKRNQTAIDIYMTIRNVINQHVSKFGQDLFNISIQK
jgi:hemerythrin